MGLGLAKIPEWRVSQFENLTIEALPHPAPPPHPPPGRVFPCQTPVEVRASLPPLTDVVVFQCRNPVHRCGVDIPAPLA
jgi:hypothetical protein